MLSALIGILGRTPLGRFLLGAGGASPPVGPTMALGLTYDAMKVLLGAKSLYMATWSIGLYALSTPFSPTRVLSDYTTLAQVPTFAGYARQALGPWSAPFLDPVNLVVQVNAPLVVWTPLNAGSPGPVAGFYIGDMAGRLVGAQENPLGPVVVGNNLNPYTVAPVFREVSIM